MEGSETSGRVSLLTAEDLADRLRVSIRKVWDMRSAGELPPAVKLGKKNARWREADIARFIDAL